MIFWVTDFFFADVTRQGGEKIIIIPQQISRLTFDPYFIDFCLNIFKKMYSTNKHNYKAVILNTATFLDVSSRNKGIVTTTESLDSAIFLGHARFIKPHPFYFSDTGSVPKLIGVVN